MDHLVSEMLACYHDDRPHQGIGNTQLRPFGQKEPPKQTPKAQLNVASGWQGS